MSFGNTQTYTITDFDLDRELTNLANREGTALSQRVIVSQAQQEYEVSGDIFDLFDVTPFEYISGGRLLGGSDFDSSDLSLSNSGESDSELSTYKDSEASDEEDVTPNEFEIIEELDEAAGVDTSVKDSVEQINCTEECPSAEHIICYGTICCINQYANLETKDLVEQALIAENPNDAIIEIINNDIKTSLAHYNNAVREADKSIARMSRDKNVDENDPILVHIKEEREKDQKEQRAWLALRESFNRGIDKMSKFDLFTQIRNNFRDAAKDQISIEQIKEKSSQLRAAQLRAAFTISGKLSNLEKDIEELSLKDKVDLNNLKCYIAENSKLVHNMTTEQIVAHAFKEQFEFLALDDPVLKFFDVTITNEKILLEWKPTEVIEKMIEDNKPIEKKESDVAGKIEKDKRGIKGVFPEKGEDKHFIIQKDKILNNLCRAREVAQTMFNNRTKSKIEKLSTKSEQHIRNMIKVAQPKTKHDYRILKSRVIPLRESNLKANLNKGALSKQLPSMAIPARTKQALSDRKELNKTRTSKDEMKAIVAGERKKDMNKVHDILKTISIDKKDKEYQGTKNTNLDNLRKDRFSKAFAAAKESEARPSPASAQNKFFGSTMQSTQNVRGTSTGKASTRFVSKSGDHSVTLNGVMNVEMNPDLADVASNMYSWAYARVYDSRRRVGFCRDTGTWRVVTQVSTPPTTTAHRTFTHSHGFQRFLHRLDMPATTHIIASGKVTKDTIDISHSVDIIRPDLNAMAKPAADALMASLHLTKHHAEIVATRIGNNLTRYDNSYLFLKLFLLCQMLHDFELAGIRTRINTNAINQDAIQIINLTPPSQEMNQLGTQIDRMLTQGRFAYRSEEVGSIEQTIMMLLGAPLSAIQPVNGELQHVYTSFDMANINWTILHRGTMEVDMLTSVTSDQVWDFIMSIAKTFKMREDMRLGAVHAMRVGYGIIDNTRTDPVYFTGTLEARQLTFPEPRAHNCFWRLMNREQEESIPDTSINEIRELEHLIIDDFQTCNTLLASMLSSAISTVLNRYNLTGRELNELISVESLSPTAAPLVRRLIRLQDTQDRVAIFVFALGILVQIAGLVINSSAFRSTEWSSGLHYTRRPVTRNEMWQGRFGTRVPYLFDPIIVFPYVNGAPLEWNISEPEMDFNIGSECVTQGDASTMAWWVQSGSKDYDQKMLGGKAFEYIEYGNFAITFMLQHDPFGMDTIPRISFEIRTVVGGVVKTVSIERNLEQPVMAEGVRRIYPGTLLNWDWSDYRQRSPVIYMDDMPLGVFDALSHSHIMKSLYVGICCEDAKVTRALIPGMSIDNIFEKMSKFSSGAGKPKTKVEKKFRKREN